MKEPFYYITQYKLVGHKQWRCHLGRFADAFRNEAKNNNWPEFTEVRQLKMDVVTGVITPIE